MKLPFELIKKFNELSVDTPRLSIFKINEALKEACLLHELDEEMMRFIKDVPSIEQANELINLALKPWQGEEGEWLMLAMVNKDTLQCIGELFCRYESIEFNRIEIGYRLAPTFHQQGFMSEALTALLDELIAIASPTKFIGYCVKDNIASQNTMKKQGMALEGVLRKHSTLAGVWHDECVFGLVL